MPEFAKFCEDHADELLDWQIKQWKRERTEQHDDCVVQRDFGDKRIYREAAQAAPRVLLNEPSSHTATNTSSSQPVDDRASSDDYWQQWGKWIDHRIKNWTMPTLEEFAGVVGEEVHNDLGKLELEIKALRVEVEILRAAVRGYVTKAALDEWCHHA